MPSAPSSGSESTRVGNIESHPIKSHPIESHPIKSHRATDPELEALPEPRRPGRRLTLLSLTLLAFLSLAMIHALWGEAVYATRTGPPIEVNDLEHLSLNTSPNGLNQDGGGQYDNEWVSGDGSLSYHKALSYRRPLESDAYRLARLSNNHDIWVELRVPQELDGPEFVPPTSFVGRLVPVSELGLRHTGLDVVFERAGVPPDAYILLDGEAPATTRWVLGVIALLCGFFGFAVYGLTQLLRRPESGQPG